MPHGRGRQSARQRQSIAGRMMVSSDVGPSPPWRRTMKDRPSGRKPLLVTVLVFPGVRLLDVTGPIEVFTTANEFGGRYRVRTASPDGADVVTAAGTGLSVDLAAAQVQAASDVVVIPGGPEWPSLVKDDALLDAMRGLDARGCRTAS